jgi:hypothetical protein
METQARSARFVSQSSAQAVGYRTDCVTDYQREISWLRLLNASPLTLKCPAERCTAKYKVFLPLDPFNADAGNYFAAFLRIVEKSCPNHPERVRLRSPKKPFY